MKHVKLTQSAKFCQTFQRCILDEAIIVPQIYWSSMRKSFKICVLKLKKPLQPWSEKLRMFVEDSDLKIGSEREFVLPMKLSWTEF